MVTSDVLGVGSLPQSAVTRRPLETADGATARFRSGQAAWIALAPASHFGNGTSGGALFGSLAPTAFGWAARRPRAKRGTRRRSSPSSERASVCALAGDFFAIFSPEPAQPPHGPMLSMLHEARRRGMEHAVYLLPVCELLLEVHAPDGHMLGEPCAGCREPWPCESVLEALGGQIPSRSPRRPCARFAAPRPCSPDQF